MIAAVMLYSTAVALCLGFAALAAERGIKLRNAPSRWVWASALVGSWIVPSYAIVYSPQVTQDAAISLHAQQQQISPLWDGSVARDASAVRLHSLSWPNHPGLDVVLAGFWIVGSGSIFTLWGVAALRMRRSSEKWSLERIDDQVVSVTEGIGPAVFGYIKPQVLMPRSALEQPPAVQSIIVQHEQQHIKARDPLLLFASLLLVFLAPWNPALWWQLRRLRFAIEVDCDARVLRSGVEPRAYGETLLAMSQQQLSLPLGVVALTEPTSQLERRIRIMTTQRVRHQALVTGIVLSIAASLVVAATNIKAPSEDSLQALRKLPADTQPPPPYVGKFETMLKEKYPSLLTEKIAGTPVVTVLFDRNGAIERTGMEVFPGSPEEFKATESHFASLGLAPNAVGYIGGLAMQTRANTVLVVFSDRKDPTAPYTSSLFPDTRPVDHAIVERFFPGAIEHGVSANEGLWVLFGRDGTVLRTGRESFDPDKLRSMLESRYSGIKISGMTTTSVIGSDSQPVKNAAGKELQLQSVWLAAGSPLPGA